MGDEILLNEIQALNLITPWAMMIDETTDARGAPLP